MGCKPLSDELRDEIHEKHGHLWPDKAIRVACMVMPDGQTFWLENPTHQYKMDVLEAWRKSLTDERRKEFDHAGALGGVVESRMLKKDFDSIPCTNSIDWSALPSNASLHRGRVSGLRCKRWLGGWTL